ncbi:glycosyltransferase family 2 protein [Paenibacillus sp. 32O-W]|uniref:glycosyltransferase family 2 protein n=1 Tax=Paenibacillus sp. 32O-W TaxID=1695218 RepID=UPI0011A78E21|nr:glycosyltransferase family 2 protein [Paenibacillus sp. 32O-W]
MSSPLVSVVIVNYNGEKFLEECLLSVFNQSYKKIEIVVLDNNSTDNSVHLLKEYSARINLITSKENLGFARGNNVAIRKCSGKYVALLNNDAVARPDWLEKVVAIMEGNPALGSAACKIISYNNRSVMDSAGLLLTNDGMSRGKGREEGVDSFNETREILIPSGCAAIYRKKALDEVGLFDEDFFCYCEDTDLGLRLQLFGWRCIFVADSIVYHRYSETAGKFSPFKAYLVERNHFWVVMKNYPGYLLWLNPFFTIKRYIFQIKSLLKNEGTTAELARDVSIFKIIQIMLKSHIDTWKNIIPMMNKRKFIQKNKVIKVKQFKEWLNLYGVSLKDLFRERSHPAQAINDKKFGA